MSVWVLACSWMGGRSISRRPMSWMMSASAPASYTCQAMRRAASSSSSRKMVLSVMKMRVLKRCACAIRRSRSRMSLPAPARAPKAGPPMYTASAPWLTASMPMSASRAGESSSIWWGSKDMGQLSQRRLPGVAAGTHRLEVLLAVTATDAAGEPFATDKSISEINSPEKSMLVCPCCGCGQTRAYDAGFCAPVGCCFSSILMEMEP